VRRSHLIFAIGWLVSAAPARADHATFHGTVVGSVATTDNVFATTRDNAEADAFMQVRPGMLFSYDAPRFIQVLTGEVEFLDYVAHSDKPSVTFRAAWQSLYLPGPRSELTTSVDVATGQLNAMATRTSPDQAGVNVIPPGRVDTRQGNANEYYSYQAGKDTRFSQTGFGRWFATKDADPNIAVTTESYEAGGALAIEHSFEHDTFGLEGGVSYLYLKRLDPNGVQMGNRLDRQVNPRAVLTWRHDINRQWSFAADGGGVWVNPIGTDPYNPMDKRRSSPFPVFGGTLAYTEAWGHVTVTARRSVAPNLFIAENTVNETGLASLAMPLPWLDETPHARNPKLVGLASLGFERTQLIDSEMGDLLGRFYVGHLDAGVGYTPKPGQTYGLRYEFMYQTGDSIGTMVIPSFWRNTLYFTFSLRYPDEVAAKVPRRTQSLRSDRKDLSPLGDEPVVPDPVESLPDE
jgi:hypothetical protein